MTTCRECGGDVVVAYKLPGGDVIAADDMPPGGPPMGVVPIEVCRSCGHRP